MYDFENAFAGFIEEIKNLPPVDCADIPNIDLYMDQATTFMDTVLAGYKRQPEDKILTKTMINNYAKAKIFPPPIKKKYSKNHLMLLIIIYHLKTVLSIQDIGDLLKPITDELNKNENSPILEQVYKGFVTLQRQNVTLLFSPSNEEDSLLSLKDGLLSQFDDDKVKMILIVLILSIKATTEKRLSEKILDSYFKPSKK